MRVWLETVYFTDGTVTRYEQDDVNWIQGTDIGVRVSKGESVRLYPWHRVSLCVEQ